MDKNEVYPVPQPQPYKFNTLFTCIHVQYMPVNFGSDTCTEYMYMPDDA